jgi:hypothetical protein
LLNTLQDNDATMRTAFLMSVVVIAMNQVGCTNAILGTVLAPEAVVGGALGEVAKSGAQSLSDASLNELSDLGNTILELDRILAENPDAVNAGDLRKMRQKLIQQNADTTASGKQYELAKSVRPRRAFDTSIEKRPADNLRLLPLESGGKARRSDGRPSNMPSGSSLQPEYTPVHMMSVEPVRLSR